MVAGIDRHRWLTDRRLECALHGETHVAGHHPRPVLGHRQEGGMGEVYRRAVPILIAWPGSSAKPKSSPR